MRILFIYQNPERVPLPVAPLGMLTVAAAASHAGHSVSALDLSTSPNPSAEIKQRVKSFTPDAVGISIRVLTQAYSGEPGKRVHHIDGAKVLVELVRATTSAPIILGGPGFSHAPLEVFRFLEPDYGIEGEGERSLPALLNALGAKDSPEHIPGLLMVGRSGRGGAESARAHRRSGCASHARRRTDQLPAVRAARRICKHQHEPRL